MIGQSNAESQVDSSSVKSPGKALLYSIIPGGGQLYTRHPIKAVLFAGSFIYYGYGLNVAQQDYNTDESNLAFHRKRNDKIWMMSLIWTLNLIDAYVDAQLWDFESYDIEGAELPEQVEIIKPKKVGPIDGTE